MLALESLAERDGGLGSLRLSGVLFCAVTVYICGKVLKRTREIGEKRLLAVRLSARNNSPPTGLIFMESDFFLYFSKMFGKNSSLIEI